MSWFDATGFANLAMTALKEAQKTIDKALDIKDEDQKPVETHKEDTSDFFASWGLKKEEDVVHRDKSKDSKQDATNSIWGSFTGSFFESPKFGEEGRDAKGIIHSKSLQTTPTESDKTKMQKFASSLSLSEDYKDKKLSPSKNTKRIKDCKEKSGSDTSYDIPSQDIASASTSNVLVPLVPSGTVIPADTASSNDEKLEDCLTSSTEKLANVVESCLDENDTISKNDQDEKSECEKKEVSEHNSNSESSSSIKLSFLSPGSDKKSLENVEILGSRSNTNCTTTPESERSSLSNLASPSTMGTKVNSESVEVLPDSLVTSPSSVEILGEWKSDSSPYISPVESGHSELPYELDRDDTITPCWEDINVAQIASKNNQTNASSPNVSSYDSPVDEAKTPCNNLSTNIIGNTSAGAYSDAHSNKTVSTEHIPMDTSTENIEATHDTNEPDEVSLAEDSYTSASETTVMTILETFQQKEQIKSKMDIPINASSSGQMHDLCSDGKQMLKKGSMDASSNLNLNLDSMNEKHNLHLPIEAITTQPIRKPEYFDGSNKKSETDLSSFDRLINATIEPAEPERYSSDEAAHPFKSDTLDITDQHLISTDSSCEGTLIESSSEDNPQLIHKSEEKILEVPLSASSYVKTMLADAMIEKREIIEMEGQTSDMPRENSPISSESRSDLVKIGSDQTSGHTSGDELETTTSSDIEIISSPNGDSSSTQSRQSLAKLSKGVDLLTKTLKTRGHSRELSEISVGSDEANVEIEKLLKRIQEMTEILEARESKLIDVSRINVELQEQNNNLKKQLDNFEKNAEQNQNLNQITDEYTQRLSALERKFQQAIRERDSLRKNLEQLKVEAATRLSSQEMFTLSAEKDEIIKELREEGEKLSKQQLQHSNIIKKLRVKEKENDALIKSQKEQIEEQTSELERLKRSLHAKEEVERSQIEAVHTLTAKTKKQEKEILTLQEKLDSTLHKMDAYKTSLDAAKIDLTETKKILAATEAELKEVANSAGESCQLLAQVEELKIKLRESEETHVKKEEFLKHENSELLKRLEAAEARSEELSESVSTATKPLLRQLEQLQANLLHKTNNFMKQEKALSDKNIELQTKVENLTEADRYLKEENVNLKSKISQLESKLVTKENEKTRLQELCDELTAQKEKLTEEKFGLQQKIETLEQSYSSQITELKREIVALENKLAIEKAATDAERRKNHAISEQQQSIEDNEPFNPIASTEQDSVNVINSIWPLHDSIAEDNSETYTMNFDSIRTGSGNTSIFENLQAQLKQKDGEIQQLQWELSRRNVERDALNTELSTLTLKIEELNTKVIDVAVLNESLHEIQTRYDALLQMYGEKMEENQELRLDLEDIKEMYKTQIDQLLKRDT
ncbi:TATA element modulatory factor [Megachile rotundata]|uniref:TATA element modulatory factor n=1 Tax=Megachile rotundata TaxID=143995 RepID=UPI0006153DD8|nr:PREDICTED: TATA element modulatory factor [Megachile rotundata]XP_012139500.1 PREDICTED: TATA element modulatory factor [Megachile rotundata]XP_012139501.1 PREDICTED: TATA element modulatory factor [Megachile rotundata]XP_012139502.1 PREDICTED: TATA element modulatory factor [Megachile rotundata]XP_012139503.1 PREDICTED: TATA element modulatory factor [Megachile rotundata]XP_012139505.1 PREDICTED: TATA element modulatory factor [Megachile rotundata]XP_012139506.1 PREDICTED: TATA element mo